MSPDPWYIEARAHGWFMWLACVPLVLFYGLVVVGVSVSVWQTLRETRREARVAKVIGRVRAIAHPRTRGAVVSLLLLMLWGCGGGGSGPTAPSPSAPTPMALAGRVTATNGGHGLSALSVAIGPVSTITDSMGAFTLLLAGASLRQVDVTGDVLGLPRSVWSGSSQASIDAIIVDGQFDARFYRQFVRNGYETPETLQRLRRWTQAPKVYLRTVDDVGAVMPAAQLESTATVLLDTASRFTGGRFGLVGVEQGPETREGVSGWLTVKWLSGPTSGSCGEAQVGVDGGYIALNYRAGGECRCGPLAMRPRTVRHELGHALGYWHTDNRADLMSGLGVSGCDQFPSAREQYHAAIAYARPVGNLDPDSDPSSAVTMNSLARMVVP